jgi:hypothetical protein
VALRSERQIVVVVEVLLALFQTVVNLQSKCWMVVAGGKWFGDIKLHIVKVLLALLQTVVELWSEMGLYKLLDLVVTYS